MAHWFKVYHKTRIGETGSGSPKPVPNQSHETGSTESRNQENSVAAGGPFSFLFFLPPPALLRNYHNLSPQKICFFTPAPRTDRSRIFTKLEYLILNHLFRQNC